MPKKETQLPTWGLVLVRISAGAILCSHGWRWIQKGGLDGRAVRQTIQQSLADLPGPLAWWGEEVLLVNPDAMAFFTRWGALFCGLLLFSGSLTRPAGWISVLLLTHAYVYGPASHSVAFLLLLVSCLACALSRAGRRVGMDSMFDQHFPGWMTWTKSSGSLF